MRLVSQLEVVARGGGAGEAFASLRELVGTLRVHVAMEDQSFYLYLVAHCDQAVRGLAQEFLAERRAIEAGFEAYQAKWRSIAAIDAAPAQFVAETREVLATLGQRMLDEDRSFHPKVRAVTSK